MRCVSSGRRLQRNGRIGERELRHPTDQLRDVRLIGDHVDGGPSAIREDRAGVGVDRGRQIVSATALDARDSSQSSLVVIRPAFDQSWEKGSG